MCRRFFSFLVNWGNKPVGATTIGEVLSAGSLDYGREICDNLAASIPATLRSCWRTCRTDAKFGTGLDAASRRGIAASASRANRRLRDPSEISRIAAAEKSATSNNPRPVPLPAWKAFFRIDDRGVCPERYVEFRSTRLLDSPDGDESLLDRLTRAVVPRILGKRRCTSHNRLRSSRVSKSPNKKA